MSDGCKLFVYGVDQYMENEELSGAFSSFGSVTDVYNSGKGFAFVTFSCKEEASAAIQGIYGGIKEEREVVHYQFNTARLMPSEDNRPIAAAARNAHGRLPIPSPYLPSKEEKN